MSTKVRVRIGPLWRGRAIPDYGIPSGLAYDYDDATLLPYAYTGATQAAREVEFFANWPFSSAVKPTIVDLVTGSGNFRTDVINTLNAAGGAGTRVAIRLGVGTYNLTSFVLTGSSQTYAFGIWDSRLVGFIGQGWDQTVIRLAPNAINSDQLTALAGITTSNLNQMECLRIDGTPSTPAVLVGVRLIAADQPNLASTAAGQGIVTPQPAPHGGVFFYKYASYTYGAFYVSHVLAEGFGRASSAAPPFEHANFRSMNAYGYYFNSRIDGRASALVDAARPRRCGLLLMNSEQELRIKWCHMGHNNVSRYAVNDQSGTSAAIYEVSYSKIEQVSNTQNTDPVLGALGGYTNASCFGWETFNGTSTVHHCVIANDGTSSSGQVPAHFQFTYVTGGRTDPAGGRHYAYDNTYRVSNASWAHLDGYAIYRIPTGSHWYSDGPNTTIDDRVISGGTRKTAYIYTGTWPPSAGTLSAAGVTPATHFIVRP